MAIDSYTNLKNAISIYAGSRADLSARADEFIDNVEVSFNRRLRLISMQKTQSGTFALTNPSVALPADYLETRTLTYLVVAGTQRTLTFKTPEQIAAYDYTVPAQPVFYTISGGGISTLPVPDQAYAYTLTYYGSVPALSGTTATNAILTAYPDAYLYGCLFHAATYLRNFDEASGFKGIFEQFMTEIIRADRMGQFRSPVLAVDPALVGPQRYSILTDGP